MRIYKYIIISVIIIAALSFHSYAAEPVNNVDMPIQITFSGTTYGSATYTNLQTGQMLYAYLITPKGWTLFSIDNYLNLSNYESSDVYLCYYTLDDFYWGTNTLAAYRDPSGDMNFEWHNDSIVFTFTTNNNSISYTTSVNTSPTNYYITAEFYNDVPAASYTVIRRCDNLSASAINYDFAYGVYIYTDDPSTFDDYINGDISFEDAIDKINKETNVNVDNAPDLTGKLVALAIGEKQIQEIVQASDNKSLNDIKDVLTPVLDDIIEYYENGTIDLDAALEDSYTSYTNSLDSAETPEQGILVNTTYNNHLKNLELRANIRIRNLLLSIITDDELKMADDYYETEDTLIKKFDLEEFKSKLDFEQWFLSLPSDERMNYRRFFEYILNESPIRNFIIIPMYLGLISILLGTSVKAFTVIRRKGGDNN